MGRFLTGLKEAIRHASRNCLFKYAFLATILATAVSALQAQSFVPVPSLSFTKIFAGVNPLPQTITVAATGGDLNFNAAVSTSGGGSWLSIAGLSCSNTCGTTSQVVSVAVNPAPTLSPGTYIGQVTFSSGSKSLAVQVVLIIVSPGTSFFDGVPGQMSFFLKTNGSAPPNQNLQVRNALPGSFAWTLSVTTGDGGNWLYPNVSSGTTGSLVTVAVVKANLPGDGSVAGTFIGQIRFTSASGAVTMPVSVVVGDNVFQQINPLGFTKVLSRDNPLLQVLTIASTAADFNFSAGVSVSNGGNWLSIAGLGCSNTCGTTSQAIVASITADPMLPVGSYTGQIVFTTGKMAMTVPVTLVVAASTDVVFDNLPGNFSFLIKTNATSVASQSFDLRNAGVGTLNWTVSVSTADGGSWLSTSVPSGTAPTQNIGVSVSVANLPYGGLIAGTFIGQLLFQQGSQSITVPVHAVVGDNVFEQTQPMSFTQIFSKTDSLNQTITVASTGTPLGFSGYAYTGYGAGWLNISGLGCSDTCGTTSQVITVGIDASSLAAGSYTGQIVLNTGKMAMTIPVSLTVRDASTSPLFDNLPGQLSFFIKTGAGNPNSQTLQIRNAGTGTLDWTVTPTTSDRGSWLGVSATAGTAPSQISVSVSAQNLPYMGLVAGTFTGFLNFRSAYGSESVPVSVVVGSSVFVQAAPLSFSKGVGGANPVSQSFTISSTGSNFSFSAYAASSRGGNWLSVSGLGCSDTCGTTPQVITANVNADASLTQGCYTGQIVAYTANMAMTIPVNLIVGTASCANTLFTPVKVGTYNAGIFALDANGNGQFDAADKFFSYVVPQPGDIAVTGDWNGDGRTKAGIYRNGFWILDYNGNGVYDYDGSAANDKFYAMGGPAGQFIPVVGDWNGDGRSKIGYYNQGFWLLDYNGNGTFDGTGPGGDKFFGFGGTPNEVPLLGDWNHDGRTKIGYFSNGTFVLDYNGDGLFTAADKSYLYLAFAAGDKPVVGDWSGTGFTKIGINRSGFWILDYNGNGTYDGSGAGQDKFLGFGGNPGETPIVGDWNGDGKTKIGTYWKGFWTLDYNGNGTYDGLGAGQDLFIAFGGNTGEQPLIGKW